jgi:DNA-binding MarR family transcriptional regulator
MTDVVETINSPSTRVRLPGSTPAEEPAFELIELLFFAYRDFVADPDVLLARYGFGRAHHRVLHFVSRNPGLKVADLLTILKITKQSLGRVLRDLVEQGFIEVSEGVEDRRQRLLRLTAKGAEVTAELTVLQGRRISEALAASKPGTRETVVAFLSAMVNAEEREDVLELVTQTGGAR